MTDEPDTRPLCQWVHEIDDETGSLYNNPTKALKKLDEKKALRCTRHADVAFKNNDKIFYACEFHCQEHYLEELQVEIPEARHREGRISV